MKLLGIDPSSTRTGYAVMSDSWTLEDAGYLRPKRERDEPIERIRTMMDEVATLVA